MLRSDRHRFHFDHFIAHTANIYFPLQPNTILSFVIPIAGTHGYMLGALLAASYSHYYRLAGNEISRTASIEATVETLARLRSAITTTGPQTEGTAVLPTSLLLATTCLCAGDTDTYRKHLDGAILIVSRDVGRYKSNPLWDFSQRWLVHLLLMNRVSGLPLPPQQEGSALDWTLLLQSMPISGHVDESTGLSHELVAILNEVCDLSDLDSDSPAPAQITSTSAWQAAELPVDFLPPAPSTDDPSSLVKRLLAIRTTTPRNKLLTTTAETELHTTHALFTKATLLTLYRRVHCLPKHHPKVQSTVASMISSLRDMDKHSQANIPLLWPLLAAGCEAATDEQRLFVADRMMAMGSHGLGNCLIVLEFMRRYWVEGGDSRWNDFAKKVGVDLVLF
ncbi:hypothetical protein ACHAQH_001542 [Verticillium albo-atrum]